MVGNVPVHNVVGREHPVGATSGELQAIINKYNTSPVESHDGSHAKDLECCSVDQHVSVAGFSHREMGGAVLFYAFCSSTLLVINKVAMVVVPDVQFLLFCQFVFACIAVRIIKVFRPSEDIELLTFDKARKFAPVSLIFWWCLHCNMKALEHVNVESVIAVTSCTPLAIAVLDRVALGHPLPSPKGCLSLFGIAIGVIMYVGSDEGFRIRGYVWLIVYFFCTVFERVFVKFMVDEIPMSTLTRVYYLKALALPLVVISAVISGEYRFLSFQWTPKAFTSLILVCIVGTSIAYANFNLRRMVSATSFSMTSVTCKMFTVLINDSIWSQHANLTGHVSLLICFCFGFLYERAKVEQTETVKVQEQCSVEISDNESTVSGGLTPTDDATAGSEDGN